MLLLTPYNSYITIIPCFYSKNEKWCFHGKTYDVLIMLPLEAIWVIGPLKWATKMCIYMCVCVCIYYITTLFKLVVSLPTGMTFLGTDALWSRCKIINYHYSSIVVSTTYFFLCSQSHHGPSLTARIHHLPRSNTNSSDIGYKYHSNESNTMRRRFFFFMYTSL